MEKNNILEKKCRKCEIIKDIKEFSISRSSKDGYQNKCKGCVYIYNKKWREENKDKIKEYSKVYREENKDYFKKYREENKDYFKKYREENKDKIKEYSEVYYGENKDKIKEYREENKDKIKEYREENKDKMKEYNREYHRSRFSSDPLFRLSVNIRSLIRSSLRNNGYKKDSKTNDILGCSYEELLDHLNDNKYGFIYGDDNLDIDHIIPSSRARNKDEMMELNHYSNLQLLPAEYNRVIKRDNDFDNECLEEWLKMKSDNLKN